MINKTWLVPLLALALCGTAAGDAFKCKTRDGKTMISSTPCEDGSRTEAVRQSDVVTPQQRREAEQQSARDRERLAEREKARAAEEQKEQDARRRVAEDAATSQAHCVDNAQREPDPTLRANLIAACNGVAPAAPIVVQQPIYVPVAPRQPVQRSPSSSVCVGSDCNTPRQTGTDKNSNAPFGASAPTPKNCRQVGNETRCN